MTVNREIMRGVSHARVENREPELRAARYLSVNLGVGTCTWSERTVMAEDANEVYLFEKLSRLCERRGIDEHVDVVRPFLGFPVDAFNDDLLRALISEQKPFM